MFFRKLTDPPKITIDASEQPTMFGDRALRINGYYYVVVEHGSDDGISEIVELKRGEKTYVVAANSSGEHCCTCEDFEYSAGRVGRPCKHIAAVYQAGLLSVSPPQYLRKEIKNGDEATDKPDGERVLTKSQYDRITSDFA